MSSSALVAHCSLLSPQRRRDSLPIWSCSVWGLPCPRHYWNGGALLPHLFTLTPPFLSNFAGGAKAGRNGGAVYFLWHFPSAGLDASCPDVIRHTALRSSDFPPAASRRMPRATVRPGCLLVHYIRCSERNEVKRHTSEGRLG